jgi:hypothetical protein
MAANPSIQSRNAGSTLGESTRYSESVFRKIPLAMKLKLCGKICASSFRRFLFRIRSMRTYKPLDFGAALRSQEDGSWQANERTDARIQSIDKLLAKHPWADYEDARMFLEGFDAGEKWVLGIPDK